MLSRFCYFKLLQDFNPASSFLINYEFLPLTPNKFACRFLDVLGMVYEIPGVGDNLGEISFAKLDFCDSLYK